jgi:hypothetical protein
LLTAGVQDYVALDDQPQAIIADPGEASDLCPRLGFDQLAIDAALGALTVPPPSQRRNEVSARRSIERK